MAKSKPSGPPRRYAVASLLALAFASLVIACFDQSSGRRTGPTITAPSFFTEADYDETDLSCPDCAQPSPVQKRNILAAIINIQTNCPTLGDPLLDMYNSGQIFIHSDTNYWGKFYYNTSEISLGSIIWSNTTSDSLEVTLRHEGYHSLYLDESEDAANLAEWVCPDIS